MRGRIKFRYGHSGHYHCLVRVKEGGGMSWTQHPTHAPKDAHSARFGYDSERAVLYHVYHKVHGQVGESRLTPSMLLG